MRAADTKGIGMSLDLHEPGEPVTAVVVGSPRAASPAVDAASYVSRALTGSGPDLVVDLATFGVELIDWQAGAVNELVAEVGRADLVVVACPARQSTYTGLLKLFLDRFSVGQVGLAVPLLVGVGPEPVAPPRTGLRPVLTQVGAVVPTPDLFLPEQGYDEATASEAWLTHARPVISASLRRPRGAIA